MVPHCRSSIPNRISPKSKKNYQRKSYETLNDSENILLEKVDLFNKPFNYPPEPVKIQGFFEDVKYEHCI